MTEGELGEGVVPVLLEDEVEAGAAFEVPRPYAEQGGHARVGVAGVAAGVDLPDAVVGGLDDPSAAELLRLECLVGGAVAIVDVGGRAEPSDGPVLVVEQRLGPGEEPAVGPVMPPDPVLQLEGPGAEDGLSPSGEAIVPVFGVDCVEPAHAEDVLDRQAAVVEEAMVDVIAGAIVSVGPDDLRDRLGETSKVPIGVGFLSRD
jgi:hypothetical protein